MNLTQVKSQLEIPTFQLNTALDKDNNPTMWMRHWDNERRIAVSIHKDTLAQIKADPEKAELGLQKETKTGSKGAYEAYRIVMYKPAEDTL